MPTITRGYRALAGSGSALVGKAASASPARRAARAFVFACLWSGLGFAIAGLQGTLSAFLHEWVRMQGSPLLCMSCWLALTSLSGEEGDLIAGLLANGEGRTAGAATRLGGVARASVLLLVSVGGTASLVGLGFNGSGPELAYMWVTCFAICVMAAVATCHAVELIRGVHLLARRPVHVFSYSPAETMGLRRLARYSASFSVAGTIDYGFAFVGTLLGSWTGPAGYVHSVQLFWPLVYVPLCLVLLFLPQIALHAVVVREKERVLSAFQKRINRLLNRSDNLTREQVDESNALADLFEKVSSTPDYVLDWHLALRTLVPAVFNLATLVVPRETVAHLLRAYLAIV